jgi:hypothetical protein
MFANAGKFEVKCAFPWEELEDVFVDGQSHVTQRITATRIAMFGPLGILARKSKVKGKTTVIVYLRDKAQGRSGQLQFQTDREDRALVHRITKALDEYMPVDPGAAPTAEAIDTPTQIRQLAELRDSGILSDLRVRGEERRATPTDVSDGPDLYAVIRATTPGRDRRRGIAQARFAARPKAGRGKCNAAASAEPRRSA